MSTFKAKLTAVNANEYKPVHLYWLLNIHFARNPPKNRRSNPFIGRINKSKNAKSCLYFPREHIEHIFQLIFRTDNVSHRDLEKLWSGLNMHIQKCKSGVSLDFVFSELEQNFELTEIIELCNRKQLQTSTILNLTHNTRSVIHKLPNMPVIDETPHSSSKVNLPKNSSTIPLHGNFSTKKAKCVQTTHTFKKFTFMSKTRINRLKESNRKLKLSLDESKRKLEMEKIDYQILDKNFSELKSKYSVQTTQIMKLNNEHATLQSSLNGLKSEYNCISNELLQLKDLQNDLHKIERFSNDPDFCSKVDQLCKSDLKVEEFSPIDMRSRRGSINPKINLGITVLRQIGHCSLEKTMPTLVLLGNLLFGQNWDVSNDITKSRQRSIVPDNVAGIQISISKSKNKVTKNTAPTQGYIRKFEREFLEPKSLQSVAEELKDENTESATLMYDHCSINRSKAQTNGVITTIRDPETGEKTSHYRNLGINSVIKTNTSSTFNTVVSALRNTAVLDAKSTLSSDIHESMKGTLANINYTVADGASEMKPVADKIADLKQNLGLETDHLYIHCNAHVCPALDQAIVIQLSDIAKMLALEDHVVKEFNASFFKKNNSAILTMVRAIFSMLGKSTKNQEWSLYINFHYYSIILNITASPLIDFLTRVVHGLVGMLKCASF